MVIVMVLRSDGDIALTLASSPPPDANKGKVVWILGSSSGIGAQLALDFAATGANVIISARREEKLKDISEKCAEISGNPAMMVPFDITNLDAQEVAYSKIKQVHNHIDVLVLNAGTGLRMFANETDISLTEELFQLNFFSYVGVTKLVLPDMIERKNGKVRLCYVFHTYFLL
jgi:short-subunit dehydrogenase